jgi:hypothetical protein
MRKALTTLAIALGLVVSSWTGSHADPLSPVGRHRQCRYESSNGHAGYTDWEARQTIRCAVDHFPTSLATAFYVAARESGYECKAQNPVSSATGVYQVVSGTWESWWSVLAPRLEGWGIRNNRRLCRANILVSIASAHRWGWSPWS